MHPTRLLAILVFVGCDGKDEATVPTTETGTPTGTPTETGTPTDTGTTTPPDVVRDPKFDAVVAVLEAELGPNLAEGVSIAVMEQGTFTWVEGFGTADPSGDVPVTPDTIFQIGSTTKQMTATLALQQVEAGTLSLDDTVETLLPSFSLASDSTWATDATLHDLLSHQGGLVDYVDWAGPSDDAQLAAWHNGFYAAFLWANNPAGAFWNYSNPNFGLAGLVTEAHDPQGRFWPDQIRDELFTPLGMTSSFARRAEVEATGRYALSTGLSLAALSNYVYDFQPVPMAGVPDPASVRPAGLVWSTPSDMCRWGSFVVNGDPEVLDDTLRAELTAPHVSTLYFDDHMAYGYGEFVWDLYPLSDGFYPLRVWEHGGNTLSFTSVLVMLPDQGVVFSILSNGYGDVWPATVEAVLRAVVTPFPEVSTYTGPELDPADLGAHVGSYLDPNNVGDVIVTEGGANGLQISMPLLDSLQFEVDPDLVPISTDVWMVTIDGGQYDLTFIRDPGGAGDPWIRNRAFVAARVEPPTTTTARLASPAPTRSEVEAALRRARLVQPMHLPDLRD